MVIKLVKATATFQVVSLSGSVVVVTKPKNLIFSSRGGTWALLVALLSEYSGSVLRSKTIVGHIRDSGSSARTFMTWKIQIQTENNDNFKSHVQLHTSESLIFLFFIRYEPYELYKHTYEVLGA